MVDSTYMGLDLSTQQVRFVCTLTFLYDVWLCFLPFLTLFNLHMIATLGV